MRARQTAERGGSRVWRVRVCTECVRCEYDCAVRAGVGARGLLSTPHFQRLGAASATATLGPAAPVSAAAAATGTGGVRVAVLRLPPGRAAAGCCGDTRARQGARQEGWAAKKQVHWAAPGGAGRPHTGGRAPPPAGRMHSRARARGGRAAGVPESPAVRRRGEATLQALAAVGGWARQGACQVIFDRSRVALSGTLRPARVRLPRVLLRDACAGIAVARRGGGCHQVDHGCQRRGPVRVLLHI